jgi:hypothetical protein
VTIASSAAAAHISRRALAKRQVQTLREEATVMRLVSVKRSALRCDALQETRLVAQISTATKEPGAAQYSVMEIEKRRGVGARKLSSRPDEARRRLSLVQRSAGAQGRHRWANEMIGDLKKGTSLTATVVTMIVPITVRTMTVTNGTVYYVSGNYVVVNWRTVPPSPNPGKRGPPLRLDEVDVIVGLADRQDSRSPGSCESDRTLGQSRIAEARAGRIRSPFETDNRDWGLAQCDICESAVARPGRTRATARSICCTLSGASSAQPALSKT